MSYSVLITRYRDHPFVLDPDTSDYAKITREEWITALHDDPMLEPDADPERDCDWFHVGIPTPDDLSAIRTPCRIAPAGCTDPRFRLGYNEATGSIVVPDPTRAVIEKMLVVAESLNAIVRGYDGEIYRN